MAEKRKSKTDLKTKLLIIAEVKEGTNYEKIKQDFGVSKPTISGIYGKRTYIMYIQYVYIYTVYALHRLLIE